jgi:hypothetical protein
LELALLGFFFVCWLAALASFVGLLPIAGLLDLGLYQYYGLAAFLGWLSGNVYLQRSGRVPKLLKRRLMLVYLMGTPGLLYLIRALAPLTTQAMAPLAPLYASGVFAIFFLVPVTLKGSFGAPGPGDQGA